MQYLNTLIENMFRCLKLGLPHDGEPYLLYPDWDDSVTSAVLTQAAGGFERPVAILTRKPLGRKLSMTPPERTVAVVAWAMYTLRRYVAFAP